MSYQVIARKWRPRKFSDLVGQSHVTQTLENAIRKGRVAHAYIFSGIRGTGKTSTARILAKALNCATTQGKTPVPCDECDSCREIAAGNSLDVLEIDAASNRGIDQIRELREMVRYAPAAGRYKVVILDEAHQLTDEASNALLKTLEEPPDNVVFILATTQAEDLVETLKSRAQFFQFRALSFAEIAGAIENIAKEEKLKIEAGAVAVLARAAEGSLRDALSLLEQAMAYGGNAITTEQARELLGVAGEDTLNEMVGAIAEQSAERTLALVNRLIADGQNLQHFCREAIRHVRNLLVARVCGADSELVTAPADERPRIAEQAALFSEEDLTRFFQILLETDSDLRRKPDPRLHMELGLLKMLNAKRLAPLEEVLSELRGLPSGRSGSGSSGASGTKSVSDGASRPGTKAGATAAGATVAAARPEPQSGSKGAQSPDAGVAPPMGERIGDDEETRESALRSDAAMEPMIPAAVAAAAAAPPASTEAGPAPEEENGAPMEGVTAEQGQAIRAALEKQKFLGSMAGQASRWEMEGGEMRIFFTPEFRGVSEMLQSSEPMEKLRSILREVFGVAIRICVKLEPVRAGGTRSQDLRRKFEENPAVRGVLERFGGRISSVRRRGEG